jgi:ATP-dependent helicase/nuclease subunit A
LFEGRDTVLLPVLQATSETVGLLEKVQRLEPVNVEKEMANRVERLLNWNYPFAVYSGKPAKVAVTEAKRFFDLFPGGEDRAMIMEQVQTPSSPSFLRPLFLQAKRGLSAAERGRAMHLVLRHLNLSGSLTEPGIRRQITEMQDMELLTPEQAKSINVKSIVGFLESALGKRLLAAKNVRREVPFTLALTVNELYPASEKSFSSPVNEKFLDDAAEGIEAIVAQGMIDCLVDEGDGFLIIDLTTDSMPPGDLQKMRQLSSSYSSQLNFYARAVQSILNRPVKEKYLYFFSDGTALLIEP